MPLLLRKLRYNRWFAAKTSLNNPLPADPLADLATTSNTLSLWEIFSDESNLSHVITALAAPADYVSNIDVAIIDIKQLAGSWTRSCMTQAGTICPSASPYHRDIADLTAHEIVEMAEDIRRHATFREFSEQDVANLLAQAIQDHRLNLQDLKPKVVAHLQKRGLLSTP